MHAARSNSRIAAMCSISVATSSKVKAPICSTTRGWLNCIWGSSPRSPSPALASLGAPSPASGKGVFLSPRPPWGGRGRGGAADPGEGGAEFLTNELDERAARFGGRDTEAPLETRGEGHLFHLARPGAGEVGAAQPTRVRVGRSS